MSLPSVRVWIGGQPLATNFERVVVTITVKLHAFLSPESLFALPLLSLLHLRVPARQSPGIPLIRSWMVQVRENISLSEKGFLSSTIILFDSEIIQGSRIKLIICSPGVLWRSTTMLKGLFKD
jgi:hypothetical protein